MLFFQILHRLGFWHEHARADRDDYIEIDWSKSYASTWHGTCPESLCYGISFPYGKGYY